MKLKTREELSNEFWMRFLRSGKIEDYLAFKRINNTKIDDVEFGIIGEPYDNSKKTEIERNNYKTRDL